MAWTVLVDFVVVPGVFRNVANFFEAGDLGIYLFGKLNNLELIVSSGVLTLSVFLFREKRVGVLFLLGSLVLFGIVLTYFTWLTPKIAHLTELWKLADQGKVVTMGDIQQTHQFYHRLYVGMDSVKLLLLVLLLGISLGKREST